MSIYSGFATRALETTYNKILYGLLYLLQGQVYRDAVKCDFLM